MSSNTKSIPDSSAVFYTGKDYQGDAYSYPAGKIEEVPPNLNDDFMSVELGNNTKAYLWQHYGATGRQDEILESTPDLSYIGGLSVFQITSTSTNGIYIKFENHIPDDSNVYTMEVILNLTGDPEEDTIAKIPSDAEDFMLVASIGDSYIEHVAQIIVFDENNSAFINGGCYFEYHNGDVSCTNQNGLDKLTITEGENGHFTFAVNSK